MHILKYTHSNLQKPEKCLDVSAVYFFRLSDILQIFLILWQFYFNASSIILSTKSLNCNALNRFPLDALKQ